jgi:IS4 transposase
MTRDDVIRLAREAHMHHMAWDDDYIEGTERFAALVAAAEREACAKACEWEAAKLEQWPQRDVLTVRACAAAIRARGET